MHHGQLTIRWLLPIFFKSFEWNVLLLRNYRKDGRGRVEEEEGSLLLKNMLMA